MDSERTSDPLFTSEQRVGISAQPKETCPAIDEAVSVVEQCQREIRGYGRLEESELRDLVRSIEWELAKLVGYNRRGMLEDLRRANSSIRDWGEQWKQQALEWEPVEQVA